MISKVINGYFKSRLIGVGSELPAIMAGMTKLGFKQIDQSDKLSDPMAYEHAVFLSNHLSRYGKILPSLEGAEKAEFEKSFSKLQQFKDLREFLAVCQDVHKTVYFVWVKLMNDISNGRILLSQEETNNEEKKMIEYAVKRYEDLLEQVKNYPAWRERIISETGYMVNLLHSIHQNDPNLEETLKNFDKQEFFK